MEWFINEYVVSDKMYRNFLELHVKSDREFADIDFTPDKEDIKFLIKRELAYFISGKVARFRVNMQRDKQLQKAIEALPEAEILLSAAKF